MVVIIELGPIYIDAPLYPWLMCRMQQYSIGSRFSLQFTEPLSWLHLVRYWIQNGSIPSCFLHPADSLTGPAIFGWLADRTKSRRLPLLLGLLALSGATLLLCFGTSIAVMVIGRMLQGFSGAVVWSVGLALLADTVGPTGIGEMVAYVSMSLTLAFLLAPLLGGIVFNKGGYFCVFYMSFGMIILDIILRTVLVEKKIAKQWIVSEASPVVNNIFVPDHNPIAVPTSETQQPSDVVVPPPQQHRYPLLSLLSSRRLWSALWCSLIQCLLMTAFDATLPLRVAELFHWGSLGAGLIFLPSVLPTFLAPFVGKYVDAHGPRLPAVLGFLLSAIPLSLLLLVDHSGIRQIVLLCALLALLGLTLMASMVPFLAEVTYLVVSKEKIHPGMFGEKGAYAQAYGIWNCAFAGGILAGPLWGGFVRDKAGWGTMCWSLGLLSAVCVVPAALWTGGWITDRHRKEGGDVGEQGIVTLEERRGEDERDDS